MRLKSFGCSFIHGTDLGDTKKYHSSRFTWPALIAKKFGWEYQCFAMGGIGNLQILESMLYHVPQEPSFFVIGWTWLDRFDYTTSDDVWQTILPSDVGPIPEYFYKNLHSQYRDKLMGLICANMAIDALTKNGHRFIMTHLDNLLFETDWHITPAISYLQSRVRPYIRNFENKTFLDWARDKNFEISESWHPLEEAHSAAADYALSNWIELKQ